MRKVERFAGRTDESTVVRCYDEPGAGGACHTYGVVSVEKNEDSIPEGFVSVVFQRGPIQENGVNGCQNEDLLAIVRDRLKGFQSGEFGCRENAIALTHIETALAWLYARTDERRSRGVEGKNQK